MGFSDQHAPPPAATRNSCCRAIVRVDMATFSLTVIYAYIATYLSRARHTSTLLAAEALFLDRVITSHGGHT
jgi:hypothetical protein